MNTQAAVQAAMQVSKPQPVMITSMAALKKINHEEVKKNDMWMVAPNLISFEPGFNARKKYTSKKQLKHIASLRNQWNTDPSQIPPLRVTIKDGNVYVRDGHCRYISLCQAMEEDGLEMTHVSCIQFHGNDVAQLMLILTSQDGLPLDFVEQADVYTRLIALGVTEDELAKKRDSSVQHIRNICAIASLPYRLQEYITNEVIPYTNALEVVRLYGETKAMELINGIVERKTVELAALMEQPESTALTVADGSAPVVETTSSEEKPDAPTVQITRKDLNKAMNKTTIRFNQATKDRSVSVVNQLAALLYDSGEAQTITLTPELISELQKLKASFVVKQNVQEEPQGADNLEEEVEEEQNAA